MRYDGIRYLQFKNFVEMLISENKITEFDTVYDLMNQAEIYDNENMIKGNSLSGKNEVEYNNDK